MVIPEMAASVTPASTTKTLLRPSPLTTSSSGPGPATVTFVLISMGPLVRVMGDAAGQITAKVMVSPEPAAATAARRVPGPASAQLVTDRVAAAATEAGRTATEKVARPVTRAVATSRRVLRGVSRRRPRRGDAALGHGVAACGPAPPTSAITPPAVELNATRVLPTTHSVRGRGVRGIDRYDEKSEAGHRRGADGRGGDVLRRGHVGVGLELGGDLPDGQRPRDLRVPVVVEPGHHPRGRVVAEDAPQAADDAGVTVGRVGGVEDQVGPAHHQGDVAGLALGEVEGGDPVEGPPVVENPDAVQVEGLVGP